MNAAVRSRAIGIGAVYAFMMVFGSSAALAGGRWYVRQQSGEADAEQALADIVDRVKSSHRTRGKLCDSALTKLNGESWGQEREKEQDVGFACLGQTEHFTSSRYAIGYERDGNRFVVVATRSPVYDPKGIFASFERRGEVRGGTLVVDPALYVRR